MDYSKLEGKKIEYFWGDNIREGLVVGVDFNIGITIVDANNHDNFILCLAGPLSPTREQFVTMTDKQYKNSFNYYIEAIKSGKLNMDEATDFYEKQVPLAKLTLWSLGPDAEGCSFNQ